MSSLRTGFSSGSYPAYLAVPELPVSEWKGAVIVIHEVWGLVGQITAVADRYAAAGYLAIAPDLMGTHGVGADVAAELQLQLSDPDPAVREAAQPRLRDLMAPVAAPAFAAAALTRLVATVDFLEKQEGVQRRIAVTGFSFGGSYAVSLAVADTRVRASVPYYGYANLSAELLRDIACPVLYFVGEDDTHLMDALPGLEAKMRESGTRFTAVTYPGAGHAFFNDSNSLAYRPAAAEDSWEKSLAFLEQNLSELD